MEEALTGQDGLDVPGRDNIADQGTGTGQVDSGTETVSAAQLEDRAPLALYRRYRPDTFADVIGQEHVTDPLQRALVNNRVNHAYLFSGPRGCGKTTSARILARALNCELGPMPVPCGQCQSCRDLARGGAGSIDVIEIDAASHGGVDDARDLRERAFFAPVHSRYKIYIVDEAHMVTTAGFNALLKLVEEPPPHVKFIFATTEPDKVIGTIRSRTHHYPFRLVPPKVLGAYLAKLCEAEGISVEPAVLPLVVRAGAGSVRDSLSVLDQLLGGAAAAGVSYSQATALLGYTPDSLLDEVLDAFAAGDAGGVFACVDKVIEVGQDPRRFAEDLLRRLRDLLIVAAVPDALSSGLVDVAADQGERLQSQAAALGTGELTRAAEVIATGLTEMRGTTAPRLHLELMCARVLLPGADVDDRGIHARLDRLERRVGVAGAMDADRQVQPAKSPALPAPQPQLDQSSPPVTPNQDRSELVDPRPAGQPSPSSVRTEQVSAEQPGQPETGQPTAVADPPQQPHPAPQPADAPQQRRNAGGGEQTGLTAADVRRLWPEVLEEVKSQRRFTWILLSQNSHVMEVRDGVLHLGLSNIGARDSFGRGGSEDVLREALIQVLGADLKIEAMVDPAAASGPATTPASRPSAASRPAGSSGVPAAGQAAASWSAPIAVAPTAGSPGSAEQGQDAAVESATGPSSPDLQPSAQARGSIRPTRTGSAGSDDVDERDAAARREDSNLDESAESHDQLLARHLGAEMIAEEGPGA